MEDTPDNAQGQPEQSALPANPLQQLLPTNPSTATGINHMSETDIDPVLRHAACIPTQTPSGERIPKVQFEAQL